MTTAIAAPQKPRTGAPRGNLNAARHGGRVDVYRLVMGELPAAMAKLKSRVREYRRDLEELVATKYGSVSMMQAHHIDAAVGWETHAGVCRWILNRRFEKLTPADLAKCSGAIATAKENRNRVLRQLKLDGEGEGDLITALYSPLVDPYAEEPPAKPPCQDPESAAEPAPPAAGRGPDAEPEPEGGSP